jgi:hypothetical protein
LVCSLFNLAQSVRLATFKEFRERENQKIGRGKTVSSSPFLIELQNNQNKLKTILAMTDYSSKRNLSEIIVDNASTFKELDAQALEAETSLREFGVKRDGLKEAIAVHEKKPSATNKV